MRSLALLLVLIAAPSASAEPRGMSQHPRVGLLAEIQFSDGSTRFPDAAGSQLGQVAAWANDNFDGLIVVDGHADARGPAAGSVRLSMRRARLVRDQLIAIGVDPSQIIISAFGSEGRRHARVAVWGTRNSIESVIANRWRARELHIPTDRVLELQQRQARPAPPVRRRTPAVHRPR
jgi:OmpA family protein